LLENVERAPNGQQRPDEMGRKRMPTISVGPSAVKSRPHGRGWVRGRDGLPKTRVDEE
jgi:hypothetical protein